MAGIWVEAFDDDHVSVELAGQMRAAMSEIGEGSRPDDATVVLLVCSSRNKYRRDLGAFRMHPMLRAWPEKAMTFDFSDLPRLIVPSLCVHLSRDQMDPSFSGSVPGWGEIGDAALASLPRVPDKRLLFSFRGNVNAPVREAIMRVFGDGLDPRLAVSSTEFWWTRSPEEADRMSFLVEMQQSHFALAPRGLGVCSFRMQEAMQLGVAPVILSDDWVPVPGIPWDEFSVRVREADVAQLPETLEARLPDAAAMGRRAREIWEQRIRPGAPLARLIVDAAVAVNEARTVTTMSQLTRRWRSGAFLRSNGWTNRDRLRRRATKAFAGAA